MTAQYPKAALTNSRICASGSAVPVFVFQSKAPHDTGSARLQAISAA